MRTLNQWFDEYAVSHQNRTNKIIHYWCVPAIFFSLIGLLMAAPNHFLCQFSGINNPLISNWAVLFLFFAMFFYVRIAIKMAGKIAVFAIVCILLNYYLSTIANLFVISTTIFAIAWIGQFYGHKIEGKKPSFVKDLQFLLIGPAWVIENIFSK